MNFELKKAGKFAKLLGLVTALHEEGNFVFGPENVVLMQTDLAKVSMVEIEIDSKFFDKYEGLSSGEFENRRFDVSTLSKWIGAGALIAKEKENFFRFKTKKKRGRSLKIPNVEGFEELPELPTFEYEVIFQAPLSTIKEAVKDCTIVSEDFVFESDEEYLTIRGESPHLGEVKDEFKWDKKTFIPEKLTKTKPQGYNALLFLDFIKALEENGIDKVKISFGYDMPIKVNTGLENVEIEYTLGSLIMGGEETETEVREESSAE